MSKKKTTIVLVSAILSFVVFIASLSTIRIAYSDPFEPASTSSLWSFGLTLLAILIVLTLPIITFIKYIYTSKNIDKYYDISRFESSYILINVLIVILGIVDCLYNILFINKVNGLYSNFPVFLFKYLLILEIIYFIFVLWLNLLKKEKVKVTKSIVIKTIINYISLIMLIILVLCDEEIALIPLLLVLLIAVIPIKKIKYNNIYIAFLIFAIAIVIYRIVTNDIYLDIPLFGVYSYI